MSDMTAVLAQLYASCPGIIVLLVLIAMTGALTPTVPYRQMSHTHPMTMQPHRGVIVIAAPPGTP